MTEEHLKTTDRAVVLQPDQTSIPGPGSLAFGQGENGVYMWKRQRSVSKSLGRASVETPFAMVGQNVWGTDLGCTE
jgi:hypothetical protein